LSHDPLKTSARFDDPNLVSRAGLVPVMGLAERAGLLALARGHVSISGPCGANAGAKIGCLVAGMASGADSIADMDVLRHGAMPAIFDGVRAPSTLGSFLRSFTWGGTYSARYVRPCNGTSILSLIIGFGFGCATGGAASFAGQSLPVLAGLSRNGGAGFGVARGVRSGKRPLAALAGAAGMLAVGCAPAAWPGHPAGAVPWVNRPAPAYVPAPQPRPTAAYAPCRARQLAGRPGRGGPAAGTVHQEVRLTNRGDRPCTLSGGPAAVTGVAVTGGTTTLTRVALGDGFNLAGPGPANLQPGRSGWVTLSYADGCPKLTAGGKADYRTLFLVLGGGRVRVAFPAALNLICGLEASRFGAPPPPSPASRSPLNVLTATAAVPATLIAGAMASYLVTLRNHSAAAVRLAPCPSYTEYLGVSSGPGNSGYVVRHYYLNCAAVRRIPARGSVTFAMRMPVPARTGQAKFDWQLQGTDVATALIVTIRRRSH